MADLEIPDEARDLVLRASWPVDDPSPEKVTAALHAAAPLIVAAELRRLCDRWKAEIGTPRSCATREQRIWLDAIQEIRRRADELERLGTPSA